MIGRRIVSDVKIMPYYGANLELQHTRNIGRWVEFLAGWKTPTGEYLSDRAIELSVTIIRRMQDGSKFNRFDEITLNSVNVKFSGLGRSGLFGKEYDRALATKQKAYEAAIKELRHVGLFRINTRAVKRFGHFGEFAGYAGQQNRIGLTPGGFDTLGTKCLHSRKTKIEELRQYVGEKLFSRDFKVSEQLVLQQLLNQDKKISQLVDALPRYNIFKIKSTLARLHQFVHQTDAAVATWSVSVEALAMKLGVSPVMIDVGNGLSVEVSPNCKLRFDLMTSSGLNVPEDLAQALDMVRQFVIPGRASRTEFLRHIAHAFKKNRKDTSNYLELIKPAIQLAWKRKEFYQSKFDEGTLVGFEILMHAALSKMDLSVSGLPKCFYFHSMFIRKIIWEISRASIVSSTDLRKEAADDARRASIQSADPALELQIQDDLKIKIAQAGNENVEDLWNQLDHRTRGLSRNEWVGRVMTELRKPILLPWVEYTPESILSGERTKRAAGYGQMPSESVAEFMAAVKQNDLSTVKVLQPGIRAWLQLNPNGISQLVDDKAKRAALKTLFSSDEMKRFYAAAHLHTQEVYCRAVEPWRLRAGFAPIDCA